RLIRLALPIEIFGAFETGWPKPWNMLKNLSDDRLKLRIVTVALQKFHEFPCRFRVIGLLAQIDYIGPSKRGPCFLGILNPAGTDPQQSIHRHQRIIVETGQE